MIDRQMPHFSIKVLLFSLIFLFLTLGVVVLKTSSDLRDAPKPEHLILDFPDSNKVEIREAAAEFEVASKEQQIFSGTTIKTTSKQIAKLHFVDNTIILNENTQLRLVNQQTLGNVFYSKNPTLIFELIQGEIYVNAHESIEIQTTSSNTNFVHSSGWLAYNKPETKLTVFSGDVSLNLKNSIQKSLVEFVVPLHNQVTFSEFQLTEVYTSLKPSKLRKELKMTSIPLGTEPEWVNPYLKELEKEGANDYPNRSPFLYKVQSTSQKVLSYFNFSDNERIEKNQELQLSFLLSQLSDNDNTQNDQKALQDLNKVLERAGEFQFLNVISNQALAFIQKTSSNTVNEQAKDLLMTSLQKIQGPVLWRIYLEQIGKSLLQNDLKKAEIIAQKWEKSWTESSIEENLSEYERQVQILHHTLMAQSKQISIGLLNVLDHAGEKRIELSADPEETRFDVAQERLQMTATLILSYRYPLAKQYLKNSYFTLNIETSNPDLASTQVFLTTGTLLAQRIEFAETTLKGKAIPIDETAFQAFLEQKQKEAQLLDELKSILEVEEGNSQQNEAISIEPSAIKQQFEALGLIVDISNIINVQSSNLFKLTNITFKSNTENSFVIEGVFNVKTNTLTEVKISGKAYNTVFTLEDLIKFLNAPEAAQDLKDFSASLDVFLTDQEKLKAEEDKALARDLAIKYAVTQLTEVSLILPDLKSNIEILDATTLETIHVKNASLPTAKNESPLIISFIYSTKTRLATDIRDEEGKLILNQVSIQDLDSEVKKLIEFQKNSEKAITDFMSFAQKNDLFILGENILYREDGKLEMKDLKLQSLGIGVNGLYDPQAFKFLTVSNSFLTAENIDFKTYFKSVAELYIIDFLSQRQIQIQSDQIEMVYPFNTIQLKNVAIADETFNFKLDLARLQPSQIIHLKTGVSLGDMTFQELKIYVANLNVH